MNRPEALIRLLPPCLHWSPDGVVRVVGRRIGLFHIVNKHRVLGKSSATIAEEYELAPELIAEVLAFAEEHEAEVSAYVADYQAELDRQEAAYQPSPAALRISQFVAERLAWESQPESERHGPSPSCRMESRNLAAVWGKPQPGRRDAD